MDHIYKPRLKAETYEEESFRAFIKDCSRFSQSNMTLQQIVEVHQSRIGPVSEARLNNITNPNLNEITEPYFLHRMKEVAVPPAAYSLKCVRKAKAANSKNLTDAKQHKVLLTLIPVKEIKSLESVVKQDETIFTLKIYEPFKYICGSRKVPKIVEEIQLMGSQNLTVLRDNIQCYVGPFLDISDNPDIKYTDESVDSGFIFINDTFYNDYRSPSALDYSHEILKWMKGKGHTKELKTATMEDTQISDLKFKLGFPYVYQHYGNCEHLLVFVDVRLATESERQNAKLFPVVKRFISKGTYCFICGLNEAMFVVVGSTEHVQDPSFICHQCLTMYHYKDGKKLGEFKAYRLTNSK